MLRQVHRGVVLAAFRLPEGEPVPFMLLGVACAGSPPVGRGGATLR